MPVVHVRDMIVAGSGGDCERLRSALSTTCPANNLVPLIWYMGCAFETDVSCKTVRTMQAASAENIAERFGITKSRCNPASMSVKLRAKTKGGEKGDWPLCEACGSLMWVTAMSRPDIANAAHGITKHMHDITEEHWKAVLRTLQYFKRKSMHGIEFQANSDRDLHADVDLTHNPDDRRSISGRVVMCGGAVLCRSSPARRHVLQLSQLRPGM